MWMWRSSESSRVRAVKVCPDWPAWCEGVASSGGDLIAENNLKGSHGPYVHAKKAQSAGPHLPKARALKPFVRLKNQPLRCALSSIDRTSTVKRSNIKAAADVSDEVKASESKGAYVRQ